MATDRYMVCGDCGTRQRAGRLFDVLRDCPLRVSHPCGKCNAATHLELVFPFGLDAGTHRGKVLGAFLPDSIVNWSSIDGSKVEFYPFLVILQSLTEGHQLVWLPYWHIITNRDSAVKTKYGQWAPFVDSDSYASMLQQARAAGYAI